MQDYRFKLSPKGIAVTLAILFGLISFIAIFSDAPTHSSYFASSKPTGCNRDIQCWGNFNISKSAKCIDEIEGLTASDFKWTDKLFERKLSGYRWHKPEAFTITYYGDRLLVQNQNGAFMRMIYECDFDPIGGDVIAIRLNPGRLHQPD